MFSRVSRINKNNMFNSFKNRKNLSTGDIKIIGINKYDPSSFWVGFGAAGFICAIIGGANLYEQDKKYYRLDDYCSLIKKKYYEESSENDKLNKEIQASKKENKQLTQEKNKLISELRNYENMQETIKNVVHKKQEN